MKKLRFALFLASIIVFPSTAMADSRPFGGGGFSGPDGTAKATVAEALKMPDDAYVTLTGHIVRKVGPEKYEFRDDTGRITVEIDDDDWRGLTVGPDDVVVIHGEVDRDFSRREIDVDTIGLVHK